MAVEVTSGSVTQEALWQIDIGEPVLAIASLAGRVIIGGSEGRILVADTDGRAQLQLALDDFLLAMATSPDGAQLAAGGSQRLRLFDLVTGSPLADHPHNWCGCLAWAAKSGSLAAGDARLVRIYAADGRLRWTSPPLLSTVAGLSWMRDDGRRLAAAAYQGVSIFEPDADRATAHLPAPGAIAGIAVSPNGRWVVGGSQDATLHGWNVRDGSDFRMSGFLKSVSRPSFEPSGRWMCCHSGDTVVCWDFSGSGPTGRDGVLAEGHRANVTALTWARTGSSVPILVSGDAAGDVALWRLGPTARSGGQISPIWTTATGDPVDALAATSDGIFSGHRSGAVRYWLPPWPRGSR
ncbi:WD40 repeat domain-containing protein [Mycobacterium sp. Aquia_216]|uniref:WD40 repeat domain-containing protein n=1 Tax=Mycobacterium sp. Aquia_216 TaxID=2991729 RepID=UPI00227CCC3D|nr:WD40 repeat domain-containing protein [Mycobacterium sp. Aquia_216]WAJ46391.1 WD40 repeat domain-containing protein [Mycobacterium sp. Aquia_216]